MPELSRDTYLTVTSLLMQQIGRNEYHIEQLPTGIAKSNLIEQNKELQAGYEMMKADYFGKWILEPDDAQVTI